jgi:hypothetical protein
VTRTHKPVSVAVHDQEGDEEEITWKAIVGRDGNESGLDQVD